MNFRNTLCYYPDIEECPDIDLLDDESEIPPDEYDYHALFLTPDGNSIIESLPGEISHNDVATQPSRTNEILIGIAKFLVWCTIGLIATLLTLLIKGLS